MFIPVLTITRCLISVGSECISRSRSFVGVCRASLVALPYDRLQSYIFDLLNKPVACRDSLSIYNAITVLKAGSRAPLGTESIFS